MGQLAALRGVILRADPRRPRGAGRMTRFSPSATETWLECPLKRHLSHGHLSHGGWTPRKIGKREMGAILGGAFAQGVNAWKSTELAGQTADPEVCAEI